LIFLINYGDRVSSGLLGGSDLFENLLEILILLTVTSAALYLIGLLLTRGMIFIYLIGVIFATIYTMFQGGVGVVELVFEFIKFGGV